MIFLNKNKLYIIKGLIAFILFLVLGVFITFIIENFFKGNFDENTSIVFKFIIWAILILSAIVVSHFLVKIKFKETTYYDRKTLYVSFILLAIYQMIFKNTEEFSRFALFIALFFIMYSGYEELK